MTSAFRNWLYGSSLPAASSTPATSTPSNQSEAIPTVLEVSPPPSDDEGEETETEDREDDAPPAFPSLNSAQRASGSATKPAEPVPSILSDRRKLPSLPDPRLASRTLGVPSTLAPPGNSLALPPTTTKPPPKPAKNRKVALGPGCGPLDWANLKASGQDLRGVDTLIRVTPSMLKEHNKKDDAWSAFNGKVYNITDYLRFHPGGEKELMRVAGRDGTKLFALTHAWVNVDYMLDACMVGFLVPGN
ncbi:cytochrome b5 [Punctularia strigosozonata HHB-11173 SS5]|uniref:cytochrome b5 n=1 Tax=Punctularia strigosozonata (strain HHB-11173) TaxID=741275 RepID=UPI0004417D4B|nr:cytochrome b5 [Punctularia strigosozonata HHB-11173 SS5]EIN09869.1 cytochrome b5 [Punctularia strigosozonata HHB-11173 SS5]